MNTKPLQLNFAAGELSPRFLCRTDIEAYAAGVWEMTNMYPLSQGPATSRMGNDVETVVHADRFIGRLFAFPVSDTKGYVVMINDDQVCLIWDPVNGSTKALFGSAEMVASYASQAVIDEVQVEISPGGTEMYFFHKSYGTRVITYDRAADTFTHALVTWTGQTASLFWPGTGFFYEGRLWVGGFSGNGTYGPNVFLASASGSYTDMTINASPTASQALSFTMSRYTAIHWIAGMRQLMIGTDRGEFVVESTDDDVIHAANINVRQQSQHGSKRIDPLLIGNNILFASPDGRKLRDTGYRWTEDAWVARDLTYVSEHLTKDGAELLHIAWAPDPENLLYAVTADGNLLIAIYEWNNNVIGWSRHNTNGTFLDVCVLPLGGTSKVFFLTRRPVVASNYLFIESTDVNTDHFLDCCKRIDQASSTTVTGLDNYEDQTVQVLVGETQAWHPDCEVQGGSITLQAPATVVHVGYAFTRRLVTMPLDASTQGGAATGTMKRRVKTSVRMLESIVPTIDGNPPADRSPSTPMDQREPAKTQDKEVVNLGWDLWAQAVVEQQKAMPLTVLGIYGDAALESL